MSVVIETTVGDITVDLYLNERPNTCLNFLKLCKIKYYNLCIFHKIERNFIAQTGDPTATGRGGESIFCHLYGDQAKYFDAELKPRLKHEKLGTLSMVNNGNNMNGSQFFITLGENLTYLDEVHTVFGEVAEGFDILLKINEAICDSNYRPYQDIRITHTVILHDPYDDPAGLDIPDASPEPTREQLESNYIGADEEIDDTKGKSMEEIEEKIKESEAKARATILEMVGDIPDVDVKPPENVLFVCKLNPVTTSEDLEVIFSRFGPIKSCEVIKDKKTGESLQYAFIEFEKEENCENAYFKMDNVLIDDRRIHVDFSQSVSKLNWDKEKSSKGKEKSRKDNFIVKGNVKRSDDYDMIFDMSDDDTEMVNDKRKRKHKFVDNKYKPSFKSESKSLSQSQKYSHHKDKIQLDQNFEKKTKRNSDAHKKREKEILHKGSESDDSSSTFLTKKKKHVSKSSKKKVSSPNTSRETSRSSCTDTSDSSEKVNFYQKSSKNHYRKFSNDFASSYKSPHKQSYSQRRESISPSPSSSAVRSSNSLKRYHSGSSGKKSIKELSPVDNYKKYYDHSRRESSRTSSEKTVSERPTSSHEHGRYHRHSRSVSPETSPKKRSTRDFSPTVVKGKDNYGSVYTKSYCRSSESPSERKASKSSINKKSEKCYQGSKSSSYHFKYESSRTREAHSDKHEPAFNTESCRSSSHSKKRTHKKHKHHKYSSSE